MDRPFLPAHVPDVPTAQAPAKPNRWKVLALWIVLILMFLAIWQFLSPAERPTAAAPKLPPCEAQSGFSYLSVLWPGATFLVVFLLLRGVNRRFAGDAAFQQTQEPGTLLLIERRFADAAAAFRSTLARFANKPILRALVLVNVANAELWAGRFEEALAAYRDAERACGLLFTASLRIHIATQVAFVHALRGDLAAVDAWRTAAVHRLAKTGEERVRNAAQLRLVEAIAMCRRGEHREAIALFEADWPRLRFGLSADWMRVVEVIRAFAEAQGALREQNHVAERLVRVAPVARGELAFLGAEWPEMQAFLAAHDLA